MNNSTEIKLNGLSPEMIDYVNKYVSNKKPITIVLKNTKGISSNDIRKLNAINDLISIKIVGGLDKEKYNQKYYQERITYSVKEAYFALSEIEKIEQGLNPNLPELDRAIYLYGKMTSHISPRIDYYKYDMKETQSLRAAYNGGICAGFSLVYKELMDRQGIKCDYVRGTTHRSEDSRHAWNVLEIDDNLIPVDGMWEANYKHSTREEIQNFNFFGPTDKFAKEHTPDPDERIQDYHKIKNNKQKHSYEKEETNNINITPCQRDDGTHFYLSIIEKIVVEEQELFKYAQCEYNMVNTLGPTNILFSEQNINELDSNLSKAFINSIMAKDRVQNYSTNSGGYMGFVKADHNGEIKKVRNSQLQHKTPKTKVFKRDDKTSFAITKGNDKSFENTNVNQYDCFEYILQNDYIKLKKDKIYSESKAFSMDPNEEHVFANQLMARKRIDKYITTNAGYVGFIHKQSNGEYNKAKYVNTEELIKNAKIISNPTNLGVQNMTTKELQSSLYASVTPIEAGLIDDSLANQANTYNTVKSR